MKYSRTFLPHDWAQFSFCIFPYVTPSLPQTGLNCGGAGQLHPNKAPLPSTTGGVPLLLGGIGWTGTLCGGCWADGVSSGSGPQNGGTKSSQSVCRSTRDPPSTPWFNNRKQETAMTAAFIVLNSGSTAAIPRSRPFCIQEIFILCASGNCYLQQSVDEFRKFLFLRYRISFEVSFSLSYPFISKMNPWFYPRFWG